jgi:osmoprotectant transport system permease protein
VRRLAALLLSLAAGTGFAGDEAALKVGSKRFTESYVLGELLVRQVRAAGVQAELRPGMGNTAILKEALVTGAIDVYPEYTGTIAREILKSGESLDAAALNARLAPLGLAAGIALGFSNSYAIGVAREVAEKRGIKSIADLARHPDLRFGFSHEFLGRRDGWPGLKAAYGLGQESPRGIDHGIAYEALAAREVDAIDLYSTDAKIARYAVVVLEDDRGFFPRYDAVLLYRLDAPARHPLAFAALAKLQGAIDASTMIRLNGRAELDKLPFSAAAAEFFTPAPESAQRTLWQAIFAPDFVRLLAEHAGLVFGSLAAAILAGIPFGIAAAKVKWLAQPVLVATGLVQTIPSLALLAFLIPLTGSIGMWPALIALFLYALLPIVRNTHTGLAEVPQGLKDAGLALGLSGGAILRLIELPIAAPTILAGVKTSAVINVGTATIAAFIGAGGFGERIAQGLALNDHQVLLAGAIPAAAFALVVHFAFEWAEQNWGQRRNSKLGSET